VTPYYQDPLVTLYHGDSRLIMAAYKGGLGAACILTDPPYGIAWSQHGGGKTGKSRGMRRLPGIVGDEDVSVRDEVLEHVRDIPAAVFGSFYAPFPPNVVQVLVYQKTPDAGLVGSVTGFRRDVEPIFLLGPWPKRDAHSSGVIRSRVGLQSLAKPGYHPHAKPLDVLGALLHGMPRGVVMDPFAGSGSTLAAAKSVGRPSIGIEIEERYCEIAAERCRQEILDFGGAA
jgi:hypothetical protein